MNFRKIKKLASEDLKNNSDIALISTLYFFSALILVALIESAVYIIARMFDADGYKPFDLRFYRGSPPALVFLLLRLALYYLMFSSLSHYIRRSFIDIHSEGRGLIKEHMFRFLIHCVKFNIKLTTYKLLVASPLAVGIYGIVHFAEKSLRDEIDTMGSLYFMLSMGFTIVWIGELVHYYLSLGLVKYIIELNPRSNFFDACDLSIKLMKGKHTQTMAFYFSIMPHLLLCLLGYPCLAVFPFIADCRLLFAKELMGNYWQDKIPAMIRRRKRQPINKRR